ncbi:MAG: spore gernimation protein GerA [Firmicutes bacterium]|nr:spore gernimation protein GerA [Bacillota bacterium]
MSKSSSSRLYKKMGKNMVCRRTYISKRFLPEKNFALPALLAELLAAAYGLKIVMEEVINQLRYRAESSTSSRVREKLSAMVEETARLSSAIVAIERNCRAVKDGLLELTQDISKNEAMLKTVFRGCTDVVFRPIKILGIKNALVIYVEGLIDNELLDTVILKPLLHGRWPENAGMPSNIVNTIAEQVVACGKMQIMMSMEGTVKSVLAGQVAILVDGETNALTVFLSGGEKRSVDEPITEVVIRGPRDGFTENIKTNISLLRRRLRTPRLKTTAYTIGEISQTKIIIAYIKGVAREDVIREVRRRLGRIKIDGVLESGYIEEFIEDEPYSPFPMVQNTERPDVVAANLLEGRVAIFTDNTPFVLLVPVVFYGQVQANEDYYSRFSMATFLRGIRLVFMFAALVLPSIYVALTTFHQQMIPNKFLISIIETREPTPFPAVVEALLMEGAFEALREAGVRLPKPVGQAVSIVGALVIGQAAVQAGIVSAPMVIVVSVTGIASFTIPRHDFSFAIRVLRFPLMLLAGTFGLFGLTLGVLGVHIHLVSLRSFGVPYFWPVAPLNIRSLKDVLIRAPRWSMNMRPKLITGYNKLRVPTGQKPEPGQKRP